MSVAVASVRVESQPRSEPRQGQQIGVTVSSVDAEGCLTTQSAETLDISANGGRLHQLQFPVDVNALIGVRREGQHGRFRIAWIGNGSKPAAKQYGIVRCHAMRRSERCLWVDPQRKLYKQHGFALEALAFETDAAEGLTEALSMLAARPYGAVIFAADSRLTRTAVDTLRTALAGAGVLVLADPREMSFSLADFADVVLPSHANTYAVANAIEHLLEQPVDRRASGRHEKRCAMKLPIEMQITRDGVKTRVYGISEDLGVGGMAVKLGACESVAFEGELVTVHFSLPVQTKTIEVHATVRHQRNRRYGLQFVDLSVVDENNIRALCAVLPALSRK